MIRLECEDTQKPEFFAGYQLVDVQLDEEVKASQAENCCIYQCGMFEIRDCYSALISNAHG